MGGEVLGESFGNAEAQRCTECIGDQVVDVGGSECEELSKLDHTADGQARQRGSAQASEAAPQDREQNTEGNKQQHIQTGIFEIGDYVQKRNDIYGKINVQRREIWEPDQRQRRSKIQTKQRVKPDFCPSRKSRLCPIRKTGIRKTAAASVSITALYNLPTPFCLRFFCLF